ncbi:MAG: tRNA glutamyl-Q(34) synthetase GluQRS [Deltaproteobacteria bacterium]|nr:tRNA glutamyl-Q(34) synthetase GluQRS [Deltaproteobacteria bacterium]
MHRTRFAPSPTGAMHLGHARTHLLAWLRARQLGGRVLMRIEDLDRQRTRAGAEEALLRDHEWLGLEWDEGPVRQSQRTDFYASALSELRDLGLVYACSCTRREVAAVSAPHEDEPVYPGTCRSGPRHPERKTATRFRMPDTSPGFTDIYAGVFEPGRVRGDFIVRRSDELFAYQLAVVVDDAEQGVTEVVRADDLLSSTPRQLALYAALGLTAPSFAHVPLVLGPTGARLAKRDGAMGIATLREAGVTREQLLGRLAFSLGLTASEAPTSLDELLGADLSTIRREPAVIDLPEAAS